MSAVSGNLLAGLPALVGVLLGLKLYVEGRAVAVVIVVLFGVAAVALTVAESLMYRFPRVAAAVLELWFLSAVAVTALATAFVTWASFGTPLGWIVNASILTAEQLKTVQGAFVGALSAYIALVFTKDIGDAKGNFWTSTQFKKIIGKASQQLVSQPVHTSPAYAAIYLDTVEGYGNIGWGFKARRIRAKVLSDFIG